MTWPLCSSRARSTMTCGGPRCGSAPAPSLSSGTKVPPRGVYHRGLLYRRDLHACSAGSAARVCVRQPQLQMHTDQETDKRKRLGALVALAEVQSQQQHRLLFTVQRICVLVALSSQRLCCVSATSCHFPQRCGRGMWCWTLATTTRWGRCCGQSTTTSTTPTAQFRRGGFCFCRCMWKPVVAVDDPSSCTCPVWAEQTAATGRCVCEAGLSHIKQ